MTILFAGTLAMNGVTKPWFEQSVSCLLLGDLRMLLGFRLEPLKDPILLGQVILVLFSVSDWRTQVLLSIRPRYCADFIGFVAFVSVSQLGPPRQITLTSRY